VVIVDEDEEQDFTIHTSINNHVSIGTVNQIIGATF
jgi:hypothetical protein